MWFECAHSELNFFQIAPYRIVTEIELPVPPEKVFQTFTEDSAWPKWFPEVTVQRWLAEPSHCEGARRVITFKTMGVPMAIRERFVAWEPGRRFSFVFEALSLPLLSAGGEDYLLEPIGQNRTRLRWHFCYDPALLTHVVHPIARALFRHIFSAAAHRLGTQYTDEIV